MKTNAIRILESKEIVHSIVDYDYNEEELDAVSVANSISAPSETVFKTLVARAECSFAFLHWILQVQLTGYLLI